VVDFTFTPGGTPWYKGIVTRVGFVLKRGSGEAQDILRELGPRLARERLDLVVTEACGALLPQARALVESKLGGAIDLLVVLGGDGTFLHGSSLVAEDGVPVLGVNLGSLGFLTSFSREEAERATLAALRGELPIEERMRLEVTLLRKEGPIETRFALNDCVVSQGALARLLDLEAQLDGTRVTTYKADGLIIATPTGSTAYNLAAGGPILTPDLRAIVLTPICSHTLTNRPLVVPGHSRLTVRLAGQAANVVMTIDGQLGREVRPGDEIVVACAARPLRVVRSDEHGYFDVLRQKLRWGERHP
jgi:NAD+ kinase